MTTSAANPITLDGFTSGARPGRSAATTSAESANAFAARVIAACSGRGVSLTNLPTVLDLLGNMGANEEFVRGVADALRAADVNAATGTVVSAADADIARRLENGDYDTDVHDITIEAAELLGLPTNSGFVDDPICAANGNFVHTDTDLVFPGTSASLNLERHYNSVASDRIGVFGAGWSSVLDVRLDTTDPTSTDPTSTVHAHLADGAVVTFEHDVPRGTWTTSGRRHLRLDRHDDGWELVAGPDRDRAWHFDPSGRLTGWRLGTSRVAVTRDEHRIVALTEQRSGRTIDVAWHDELITGLRTDDGRHADYTHGADDTLVRVETRAGWFDYAYDGRLMRSATDPDGISQFDNGYDERGRVTEQTSPFGRITSYRYEIDGATVITDQRGVRQAMVHDRRGNLIAVVDSDGATMRLHYDDADRMVQVVDRSGVEWRYVFDDDTGELIGRIDPDGLAQSWTWDEQGRKLTDTDRAGNTVSYEYDGDHRSPSRVVGPDGSVATAELDEWGLPVGVTDPDGVVTHFTWDADGQLVAVTDALANQTTYESDPAGLLTRLVDPTGIATEIDHDDAGRTVAQRRADAVITFDHTPAGRVVGGTEPGDVVWSATIGAHGAIESLSDALGGTAGYRYDTLGKVVEVSAADGEVYRQDFDEVGRLIAVTDPSGATARRSYDCGGHLVECVDAEGRTMRRTVDAWGRTLISTGPDGAVTAWTYHPTGEVATVTLPDGRVWSTEVDAFGRTVTVVDPAGARATRSFSPGGRLLARTSPMGRTERYEYDAAGRCTTIVGVDGVRRELDLDAAGRPATIRTTDPALELTDELGLDWDAHGRLVGRRTPGGRHRIERDPAGRVVAETDPTGVTRQFTYDARGLLASATDPAGGIARYEHDARGRLVAQTMPGDRTTTWAYDATGHLGRMVDPADITTEWTRDATGLATGLHRGTAGWTRELDAAGRETARSALDGTTLGRYEYDVAGRMTLAATPASSRSLTGTEHLTEFLWDDAGRITSVTATTGTSTVERDRDGWAVALVDRHGHRTVIERDAHGRIVAVHDDDAGSLHAGAPDPSAPPAHDLDVDPAGRLLIDCDGTLYRYDDAGRLAERVATDGAATSFEYGADGLLTTERGPGGIRRFTHDAAGRVATITVVGMGTATVDYDESGRRATEHHPDGSRLAYGWDALDRLVELRRTDPDGTERAVHVDVDALGRPCDVGGIPIGHTGWSSRPSIVGPTRILEIGPVSWNTDDRTWSHRRPGAGLGIGLGSTAVEVLGARVLDRATHQFLSGDPLLTVPGTNGAASSYTYAWHDPVNHVDPSGLRPISIEDYQLIREREEQGRLGQAWEAIKDDPWGTIAVVGLVGVATVVGGPIGAGIAIGMVAAAGVGLATGNFSPTQVAIGGVVGGVTAGVGSATSSTTAMMTAGGVTGAGSDLASQAFSGRPIDWNGVLVSGGIGATTAGLGGVSSSATNTTFRSAVAGGATDAAADITQQVLTGDHTVDWNSVWISAATGTTTSAVTHHLTAPPADSGEIYYRVMKDEHFTILQDAGTLTRSSETFISPSYDYVQRYDGRLVEFELAPGTTDQLESIGVRDRSSETQALYPEMPIVSQGWTTTSVQFKSEDGVVNIGLGRGPGIDIFNDSIVESTEIPR